VTEDETNEQRFLRMGVDQVRILVNTGGLPTVMLNDARIWVAQHDEEERLRREFSQVEHVAIARSAKDAAWAAARAAERAATAAEAANKRATIAIIVAAISIAITVMSISMVHQDATHTNLEVPEKH
jgi:hypothetical protein